MASSVRRPPRQSIPLHDLSWLLVAVFFVLGDVVTTMIGLGLPGVVERNPAVVALLGAHGVAAMIGLKTLVVGVAYLVYRVAPHPHAVGIPLGFAVIGVAVTGWNLVVLATVLFATA